MKHYRLLVATLVAIATTLVGVGVAHAATNPPYDSGNNAAGYGSGYNSNMYHDMDRKVCGFWGCNYDDGTNVFYNASGFGTVYRAKDCGTHRYRHQSSNGDSADTELTRSC